MFCATRIAISSKAIKGYMYVSCIFQLVVVFVCFLLQFNGHSVVKTFGEEMSSCWGKLERCTAKSQNAKLRGTQPRFFLMLQNAVFIYLILT